MSLVRAREPFSYQAGPVTMVVQPSEIFDSEDPLVRQFPARFVPVRADRDRPVEQATAAPGERRSTRRV